MDQHTKRRTRKSASGPGDRIASASDVAIYFREDCRTLRDSLQLEMVVAQYWLRIRDVTTPAGIPVGDAVGAGVVDALEREADPLSNAILRGLAYLGAGETAKRSAKAAARLADRVTGLPRQFADVCEARPAGAWRAGGDLEGECVLFAEFEHPRGPRHTIALYVDPRLGGIAKHVAMLTPVTDFEPDSPFHPSDLEVLAISEAGTLMRDALERAFGPRAADGDDFTVPIAFARAESMLLQEAAAGPPAL